MSKSDAESSWDRFKRNHGQFPMPIFTLDLTGNWFWRNKEAGRRLPFIHDQQTMQSLVPGMDIPSLLSQIRSGPVILPAGNLIPGRQFYIIPGPVPDSLAAYLSEAGEKDGAPALMTTFTGNSRRWLADIFATIDAASLRSTLMDANWDLASLRRISSDSYKILRDLTNMAEYTRLLNNEPAAKRLFDCVEFLLGIKPLVCAIAGERHIKVDFRLPGRPVYAEASLERLELAVVNLLSNSIHFSPMGSLIVLTLRVEEGKGQAIIEISDQGIGIPPDQMEKVFEPGYSVQPYGEMATGLGLTLARLIAQNERGSLTLFNTEEGLTAVLSIPLAVITPDAPLSLNQEPFSVAANDRFSPIYIGLSDLL